MDAGAELAVLEVNNRSDILPDTMVNILRVQSWDWKVNPGNGIGGAAVPALEVGTNRLDVVGAVGDTAGLSTLVTAGVLSQFKIPICGGVQNLPALSDRNNYPYFWRTTFSNRYGTDIVTLLKRWNVGRVAMVFDTDDIESKGACLDIKNALFSSGIIILANRYYHGLKNDEDYDSILGEFKRVDARYIILCAQAWSNSYYLVDRANSTGMISKKYAWFATQPPYPPDYSGIGDDSRLDKIVGMIYPAPDQVLPTDPNFIAITNKWASLYPTDPVKYQIKHLTWTNKGNYDCAGTLLYGIDKLLKANPQYTPKMLASRQLQDQLSYRAFRSTGFNGTLLNPMRLDTFGDVGANTIFTSLNATFWITGGSQPGFGEIDKSTGVYISHFEQTFYGGSSVPPPDGPPNHYIEVHNSLSESEGKGILALLVIGYIVIFFSGVLLLRNMNAKSIKANNPPQLAISLTGSLLCITSILFYLNDPTALKCHARVWLALSGLCLIIMPLIMKNYYIYRICSAKVSMTKQQVTANKIISHGVNLAVLAIQLVLLGVWTNTNKSFVPKEILVHEYILQVCTINQRHSTQNPAAGLYVLNAGMVAVMAIMAYLNRNVNPIYNECSFLLFLFILIVLLAFLILGLEMDETLVLKQCVCLFILGTAVPLFLLGPKYLEIMQESDLSKLKVTTSRVSLSFIGKSSKPKKQRPSRINEQSQTQSATVNTGHTPGKNSGMGFRKSWISIDFVFRAVFTQKSKVLLLPRWKKLKGITVCTFQQKVWLMCTSINEIQCFPLLKATTFESTGSIVVIHTIPVTSKDEKVHYDGFFFEAEFKNEEEAKQFIVNIRAELTKLESEEKGALVSKLEPVPVRDSNVESVRDGF
ncbi:periplasmic binding protein-like I [Obelidium mucronatum]|nr:periplasmic binding protein-like I [Obelidium mucronatum]